MTIRTIDLKTGKETERPLTQIEKDTAQAAIIAERASQAVEQAASDLAVSNLEMARTTEDLIDILVADGVLTLAKFPRESRDRLAKRKAARVKLLELFQ